MARRAYKLQEFVAHSRSVKCLSIGRKACRLLLTGGEDQRVNVWTIGKPSSLASLSGHSSSVECVAFDSAETLVLAGASSGVVKLWDLAESKLLRSLTGHKSKCTAVDFHPSGELFASSSIGKSLKVWDIRKKGCLQTYKGHNLGTNTIKFTPDGRWVVSGGLDSIVKVWDLTAGKLLHEFNLHDGPITSVDFHPIEFLLATGSSDRTVKFWDLETFETIGSTRVEAAGVHAMSFHPDGRTLFCGYDDSLKVYSWEPMVCRDSVDIGWSTLGDLCIHEQRLIGCSHYRNSVGIWAVDLLLIKPYGTSSIPEDKGPIEMKLDIQRRDSLPAVGSRSFSPDADMKEIKNIYVDYEKPIKNKNTGGPKLSKMEKPVDRKELNEPLSKKSIPAVTISPKPVHHLMSKTIVASSIVLRETSDVKHFDSKGRVPFSSVRASTRIPDTQLHSRKASDSKYDMKRSPQRPPHIESRSLNSVTGSVFDGLENETSAKDSVEEKYPITNNDEDMLKQDLSALVHPKVETTADDNPDQKKPTNKLIKGVAVAHGRTRSLVEKFERWEKAMGREEDHTAESNISSEVLTDIVQSSNMESEEPQISGRDLSSSSDDNIIEDLMQSHDIVLSDLRCRLTKLQMVRRFWEQNDFKGAINMMKNFPDYSVQADVIGIFMDKMEIINLELFSCLLPVLLNLVDSQTERHAKLSLEILLKLVAVFGDMIFSTISAPPSVGIGVDIHQEERIECCRHCFNQLQKLQRSLPEITRRSALLAKLGLELNLILQVHNIS